MLEAVRSYARRRPGTFLVLCGLAGVVAGRLTRSAVATRTSLDSKDDTDGDDRPRSAPATRPPACAAATPTAPVTSRRRRTRHRSCSTGVYGSSVESTEPPAVAAVRRRPARCPDPGYGGIADTGFDRSEW